MDIIISTELYISNVGCLLIILKEIRCVPLCIIKVFIIVQSGGGGWGAGSHINGGC